MLLLTTRPGQEVVGSLRDQLAALGIRSAAVVSLIGAVDSCAISTMEAGDATKDVITEYDQPFELSGGGEVVDGTPHLHVVLGGPGDAALAGHLHWAKVNHFFVNAYVSPLC